MTDRMTRLAFVTAGGVCVGLGVIGAFVPGMPTTCFLLLALYFFSRSSPKLERWLLEHPRYGASLRAWRAHRAVPLRAKRLAVLSMLASVTILAFTAPAGVTVGVGITLVIVATWLVTRPEGPATDDADATEAAGA